MGKIEFDTAGQGPYFQTLFQSSREQDPSHSGLSRPALSTLQLAHDSSSGEASTTKKNEVKTARTDHIGSGEINLM